MRSVYLGWEVVWSIPLVVAVIGAEFATLGVVGVAAATPPGANVFLAYPNASGSAIASFTPTPVMGARLLRMALSYGYPVSAGFVPGESPEIPSNLPSSAMQISSCADSGCQVLGDYRTTATVSGWGVGPVVVVRVASSATTFLFTLTTTCSPCPPLSALAVVQMAWSDSSGLIQGFTAVSAVFLAAGVAGFGTFIGAWMVSRRLGRHWVHEFALLPATP